MCPFSDLVFNQHQPLGRQIITGMLFELKRKQTTNLFMVASRHVLSGCTNEIIVYTRYKRIRILLKRTGVFHKLLASKVEQGITVVKQRRWTDDLVCAAVYQESKVSIMPCLALCRRRFKSRSNFNGY